MKSCFFLVCALPFAAWAATLRVDSVTVDSVWSSDSAGQQRRDALLSFKPICSCESTVKCSVSVSVDSGKSWNPSPSPLRVLGRAADSAFACNRKSSLTARVTGGNRQNVAFRVTARHASVKADSVGQFRLRSGDVGGWTETTGGTAYQTYVPQSLFGLIDGGAPQYNDRGLVQGIQQQMEGAGGKQCRAMVMDFGAAAKASAMFGYKKTQMEPGKLGSYSDTVAFVYELLGGVTAYAHFGKYYVEVTLTGYDTNAAAADESALFLGVYQRKAEGAVGCP